jgi:hypothetical protein
MLRSIVSVSVVSSLVVGCSTVLPYPHYPPPRTLPEGADFTPASCDMQGPPIDCTNNVEFLRDLDDRVMYMEAPACSTVILAQKEPKWSEKLRYSYVMPHRHAQVGSDNLEAWVMACLQYPERGRYIDTEVLAAEMKPPSDWGFVIGRKLEFPKPDSVALGPLASHNPNRDRPTVQESK